MQSSAEGQILFSYFLILQYGHFYEVKCYVLSLVFVVVVVVVVAAVDTQLGCTPVWFHSLVRQVGPVQAGVLHR